MLATTFDSSPVGSRSEVRRVNTAELPQLVDRILDNRSPVASEVPAVTEGPVRAGRSLLTVIRRMLERPVAEA